LRIKSYLKRFQTEILWKNNRTQHDCNNRMIQLLQICRYMYFLNIIKRLESTMKYKMRKWTEQKLDSCHHCANGVVMDSWYYKYKPLNIQAAIKNTKIVADKNWSLQKHWLTVNDQMTSGVQFLWRIQYGLMHVS